MTHRKAAHKVIQPMQTVTPPPLGFAPNGNTVKAKPIMRPTPLPKRPKGRWFVGVILFGMLAFAIHQVWTAYFRFEAYGTVVGKTVQLSPPWEGSLHLLHVREGEVVRQGQVLLTLDCHELRQKLAQLGDDLRVAQATLDAEAAKLKWHSAFNMDQGHGVRTLYHESVGSLAQEQAKLDDLNTRLRRAETLYVQRALAREELDQLGHTKRGQQEKVAKLKEGLDELKRRADQTDALIKKDTSLGSGLAESGAEQLRPFLAKIQALQAEQTRLTQRLELGQLKAPTNGVVVKISRLAGERCHPNEPVLTLLEEGSLHVVLYLPQKATASIIPDAELKLHLEPYPELLVGKVVRLGDEFVHAPEHIKRCYAEGQKLLPCYVQPKEEMARWMALRVGGVVKLPSSLVGRYVP